MDTQCEIVERFRLILDGFLSENFATADNVYFEKLITHLSAKENAPLLQLPFVIDWVDKCLTITSNDFSAVSPKVIAFYFNLTGLMIQNEWILIRIKELKIADRAQVIIERNMQQFNPSIKLGSIRMFSAFSQHSLGLAYIRLTKSWLFLLKYCNKDHTLYVVREAQKLLYELLYKFSVKMNDEQIVLEILNIILKPIKDNVYVERPDSIMINVDDSDVQHAQASTLDLLSYIFQQTLESTEKTKIANICDKQCGLELLLWKLVEMTQNKMFLTKIFATLSSFNFAKLVYEKWQVDQIAAENFNQFGANFFNIMKFCITRGECEIFLKQAELNHILWKKLGHRAPEQIQIENEVIKFENQLITFHLMPLLFILKSKEFQNEEIFDNYVMKLFEISCEHTLRICYAYRDMLFDADGIATKITSYLAYKSIHGILSMENILERDQAVLVFQAMVYALKEFILNSNEVAPSSDTDDTDSTVSQRQLNPMEMIVEIPNVLYAALHGLQRLIQRYRITWKESIETTCLVNLVAVILDNPNLSARLAVQALKLVQLSIEHFLSPNMALLVDNLDGSGLVCLGPIIVKRFHDTAWEVRDSALELVISVANISRLKFPAFQQFLLDYKICPIVYEMTKNDAEPYVRASGLKCLAQMIAINMIWDNVLGKLDIIEHLFSVIFNDSEGIVRKEAVWTLSKIYSHRKIPNEYRNTLYSSLAHCVVVDLHWEVKVNALHFWELEIEKQFTNQGMIDGTFPNVTFSKEHKKIVQLTEKEINLRIIKILNELSERGCLRVILKCLSEDCDLEVIKVAVCIVQRLLEKLKIKHNSDYDFIIDRITLSASKSTNNDLQSPNSIETMDTLSPENSNNSYSPHNQVDGMNILCLESSTEMHENIVDHESASHVIESILSSQDINLVITACEQKMNINGDDCIKHIDVDFYKQFAGISAKEFLIKIKQIDLNQLQENRQQWYRCSESFESLLDDILCAMRPNEDAIFADCY